MKLFVWDYHGVLERGNEIAAWKVTNLVLASFGYAEKITKKDALRMYGKKWYEYFEHVLPHATHEHHLELQQAGFDFTSKNADFVASFIQPNPHAQEVVKAIARKHEQILISNTDPTSLVLYLEMAGIHKNFTLENAFAANGHSKDAKNSKKIILEKYLENKTFDDIIIIGDSPGDMALKDVRGGTAYLYCHPGMIHRECEADFRITDLRDLLREV